MRRPSKAPGPDAAQVPTSRTNTFDYSVWPVVPHGPARKPTVEGRQWTAWISAGGQLDPIVCHGSDRKSVLALRRHVLANLPAAVRTGGRG